MILRCPKIYYAIGLNLKKVWKIIVEIKVKLCDNISNHLTL